MRQPAVLVRFRLVLFLLSALPICRAMPVAENGKPVAVIVVPRHANSIEKFAGEELQRHILLISGAKLEIAETASATRPRLLVGRAAGSAGVSATDLPLEHYRIKTVGNALCLVGHDHGAAGADPLELGDVQTGTLFAVYDLLDRVFGVRWLWPGELGTYVPKHATIAIPDMDVTRGPKLVQRKMRTLRGRLEEMKDFTTDGVDATTNPGVAWLQLSQTFNFNVMP